MPISMNLASILHGNCAVGICTWSDEISALLLSPPLAYTSWGKYNLLLWLVSKFLFGESTEDCHPICVAKKNPKKHRLNVLNYFLSSKASSGYYIRCLRPSRGPATGCLPLARRRAGGFACVAEAAWSLKTWCTSPGLPVLSGHWCFLWASISLQAPHSFPFLKYLTSPRAGNKIQINCTFLCTQDTYMSSLKHSWYLF